MYVRMHTQHVRMHMHTRRRCCYLLLVVPIFDMCDL